MPQKSKGMPPGPPPRLEIAALGGYVVTAKPRTYTPKPTAHAYAQDAVGPTPGSLQGDDYPLDFDEKRYAELPACLDRRKPTTALRLAA